MGTLPAEPIRMPPIYAAPRNYYTWHVHVCTERWSQKSKKPILVATTMTPTEKHVPRTERRRPNRKTTQRDVTVSWLMSATAWTATAGADKTRNGGIAGMSLLPSAPECVSVQPRTSCGPASSSLRPFPRASLSLDLSVNTHNHVSTGVFPQSASDDLWWNLWNPPECYFYDPDAHTGAKPPVSKHIGLGLCIRKFPENSSRNFLRKISGNLFHSFWKFSPEDIKLSFLLF